MLNIRLIAGIYIACATSCLSTVCFASATRDAGQYETLCQDGGTMDLIPYYCCLSKKPNAVQDWYQGVETDGHETYLNYNYTNSPDCPSGTTSVSESDITSASNCYNNNKLPEPGYSWSYTATPTGENMTCTNPEGVE